jgi:solute carrier family 23 (nucleobase transporter), member 1
MSDAQSGQGAATSGWIVYPIGSKPKIGMAVLLGIQHYLTMLGATVLIPFIVAGAFEGNGIPLPQEALALIIATMFLTSGITTLIQQSVMGNKLPIIQGGSFAFLGPMFAIVGMVGARGLGWEVGIQQVAAAIMFASVAEIILGYTGLLGYIKRVITPVAIAPTIAMVALPLYSTGAPAMASNWVISLITLLALVLYSQVFSRRSKVFMLFPVLLAILTGWIAAIIGTLVGWIPAGNAANIAGQAGLIGEAPWFYLRPILPFKFGAPSLIDITLAGSLGMLAGYLGSMVESIGDYYSCARMSEAPVPTERMISRGLGAEGLGCLIAGFLQTGNATTSYSENIGAIGLTRVASRRVVRAGAIAMIILPFFGKFSAALSTLPEPVRGALFVGVFGMIASVGLSNLQYVNLNNPRNLFIIGIGLFAGLTFPAHFGAVPINWTDAGQFAGTIGSIIQTLLSTGVAVTAFLTILLDNLLPGASRSERGMDVWEKEATDEAWERAEAEWAKLKVGEMREVR